MFYIVTVGKVASRLSKELETSLFVFPRYDYADCLDESKNGS
jgi:hypothetical protein